MQKENKKFMIIGMVIILLVGIYGIAQIDHSYLDNWFKEDVEKETIQNNENENKVYNYEFMEKVFGGLIGFSIFMIILAMVFEFMGLFRNSFEKDSSSKRIIGTYENYDSEDYEEEEEDDDD